MILSRPAKCLKWNWIYISVKVRDSYRNFIPLNQIFDIAQSCARLLIETLYRSSASAHMVENAIRSRSLSQKRYTSFTPYNDFQYLHACDVESPPRIDDNIYDKNEYFIHTRRLQCIQRTRVTYSRFYSSDFEAHVSIKGIELKPRCLSMLSKGSNKNFLVEIDDTP